MINLVTGESATSPTVDGYDFQFSNQFTLFCDGSFDSPSNAFVRGFNGASGVNNLPLGTLIGPKVPSWISSSTPTIDQPAANWILSSGDNYVGVRFTNEATGALHYGWMWKGAFGPGVHQVDPHFLKQVIEWDKAAGVDAVVLWGLPNEAARIASQDGIFAQRQPPQSAAASAQQEGPWQHVLQAWYPGYCNGYGGWHQTWTSRMPIQGNSTSIGVARDCCGVRDVEEWFFAVVIRVDGGPVLYNASSGAASCREPSESAPCPGIDAQGALAAGINCTVSCSPTSTLVPALYNTHMTMLHK